MPRVRVIVAENWITRYLEPRHPELVAPYRESGRIAETALQDGQLADADLAVLLTHVHRGPGVLADAVGDMLGKLAREFPTALSGAAKLAEGRTVAERSRGLNALLHVPPGETHERVYAAALADPSKRIRQQAGQAIRFQQMAVLIPQLTAAVDSESDDETRTVLSNSLVLLRDGYTLRRDGDVVFVTSATTAGTISSRFTVAEFDGEGRAKVDARADEWRAGWYLGRPEA